MGRGTEWKEKGVGDREGGCENESAESGAGGGSPRGEPPKSGHLLFSSSNAAVCDTSTLHFPAFCRRAHAVQTAAARWDCFLVSV